MQVSNPSRLQLINKIKSLAKDTPLKVESIDFMTDGPLATPAALKLSCFGQDYFLECKDYGFTATLPDFASIEPKKVSPYLLQGLVELFLSDKLQKLSEIVGSKISVTEYIVPFTPEQCCKSLSFSLQLAGQKWPFILHFVTEESLLSLLQLLDEIQHKYKDYFEEKSAGDSVLAELSSIVEFVAGHSHLSIDELKSLEKGDAILLEDCYLDTDRLHIRCGHYAAWATVVGEQKQLILDSGLELWQDDICKNVDLQSLLQEQEQQGKEEQAMDANGEEKTVTSGEVVNSLGDLKVELCFELERRQMSLDEVRELTTGSIVDLKNVDLGDIAVVINSQKIARGRIVEIDDRFALQLTEMCKRD